MNPPQPFYLAGPTASGKSAVAVELARLGNAEIVNADAFQLYAGLTILTAQPPTNATLEVPHHLYSTVPISEPLDAAAYATLARPVIAEIIGRNKTPLVVGGSGLYLKALTHGLSDIPKPDPTLRAELAASPLDQLVSRLRQLDPDGADQINLKNPRYVQRAVEICLLTGKPASVVKAAWQSSPPPSVNAACLTFADRQHLYDRINDRTLAMLDSGAIDEVAAATGQSITAAKAIGFREIRAYQAHQLTLEEAIEAIQQATRRYAKRQLNWFRRESVFQTICLDRTDDASSAASKIAARFPALFSQ